MVSFVVAVFVLNVVAATLNVATAACHCFYCCWTYTLVVAGDVVVDVVVFPQ